MSRLNVAALLADDTVILDGVPSRTFPNGKSYAIPSLSAEDGKLFVAIGEHFADLEDIDKAVDEVDDGEEHVGIAELLQRFLRDEDGKKVTLQEKLFGASLAEMRADGVSNNSLQLLTEVVCQQAREGAAATQVMVDQRVALERALGEARARTNRASRRAAARKSSPAKKAPAKPRKSASGSSPKGGSSTRRGSSAAHAPAKKAAASTRGRRTSPSGSASDSTPAAKKTA